MEVLGIFSVNPETFTLWTLRVSMTLTTGIFLIGLSHVIAGFRYARSGNIERLKRVKNDIPGREDTFAETVARILLSTEQSEEKEGRKSPTVFLHDATRQVAENIFDGR